MAGSFHPGHISPLGYLINTTYFWLQLFGEAVGFSLIFELRLPLKYYVKICTAMPSYPTSSSGRELFYSTIFYSPTMVVRWATNCAVKMEEGAL